MLGGIEWQAPTGTLRVGMYSFGLAAAEKHFQLIQRQRLAIQKALELIASVVFQEFKLRFDFNALCDDLQSQFSRQSKN